MKPRWLLNENFPVPAVRRLRAAGCDVLAIAESATSAAEDVTDRCLPVRKFLGAILAPRPGTGGLDLTSCLKIKVSNARTTFTRTSR